MNTSRAKRRGRRRPWCLLLPALLASAAWARGQEIDFAAVQKERRVTAVRAAGQILLDGELDEPDWERPVPATEFVQREPKLGAPPSERTEVRLLYDGDNLYFGVRCFESNGRKNIVVSEMIQDYAAFDTDAFTLILDPFDDNRNGFLFGVNPAGGRRESQITSDGANINIDWDTIWYAKTKILDWGWQAEIAIPFKSLRFGKGESRVWGVNFLRRMRRRNEEDYWSPVPRPHRLDRISQAGSLEGLDGVRQGRNFYLKPYLSIPVTRGVNDDVDFLPDAGFDVKYGVTSGLTLDLTANTDFSQVEADEAQINLTRFSLFFPEKREFFLENWGIFQLGRSGGRGGSLQSRRDLIPFFTRRIGIADGRLVPILGGARVTGRVGRSTLGMLSLQTDGFEGNASTNFSVARVRWDIFRKSEIGGMFVNKQERGGRFNRTYGVDGNFTVFTNLDMSAALLKTVTPERSGKDFAADLSMERKDRHSEVRLEYLTIGENFNPEAGFVPRRGMRKTIGEFTWTPRPGERFRGIREFRPSVGVDYITSQENTLETRTVESSFAVVFENGANLTFSREASFERLAVPFQIRSAQNIPIGDYQFAQYSASFTGDRSRMLSGSLTVARGSFYDGDRDTYGAGLRFQPGYRFKTDVVWSRNDIALPSGPFRTDLVTARVRYSFTPDMSVNALIQYNSTLREISSNIRFNVIYRPLSDLFLVYNERRTTGGQVTERALIAKLTYVLHF